MNPSGNILLYNLRLAFSVDSSLFGTCTTVEEFTDFQLYAAYAGSVGFQISVAFNLLPFKFTLLIMLSSLNIC